ncbi:MAG: prolyl oligopeptidase family serine peptidase, partial [Pseudomonadota bacterium]
DPIAGIVGFSGRLLHPGSLAAEAVSKPPVLLIHGDADQVVPYTSMPEAETALKGAGFSVETHTSAGIGHGIGPDGLGRALGFMQGVLA